MVCFRLTFTALDKIITQERATFVTILLISYWIYFVAPIRIKIHVTSFDKTSTLCFHYLIQDFFYVAQIIAIQNIGHRIKVKNIADNSLIKDLTNSILSQRAQLSPNLILVHFEGFKFLLSLLIGETLVMIFIWQCNELSLRFLWRGRGSCLQLFQPLLLHLS